MFKLNLIGIRRLLDHLSFRNLVNVKHCSTVHVLCVLMSVITTEMQMKGEREVGKECI